MWDLQSVRKHGFLGRWKITVITNKAFLWGFNIQQAGQDVRFYIQKNSHQETKTTCYIYSFISLLFLSTAERQTICTLPIIKMDFFFKLACKVYLKKAKRKCCYIPKSKNWTRKKKQNYWNCMEGLFCTDSISKIAIRTAELMIRNYSNV